MNDERVRVDVTKKTCVECGRPIEERHESFLYECERCMNERE